MDTILSRPSAESVQVSTRRGPLHIPEPVVLWNMVDKREQAVRANIETLEGLGLDRFRVQLPKTVRFNNAETSGEPLVRFDSGSLAASAMWDLADEVLERLSGEATTAEAA
jgi:cellulose biosynthesis protein BcsQ